MKRIYHAFWYGLTGVTLFCIDRFLKSYAATHCAQGCRINDYFSMGIAFNRGTSWGMFHSDSSLLFMIVTGSVILLTGAVFFYAFLRMRMGHSIIGEVMVLAGSLSNIADRFLYGGVMDFIELSYHGWVWPTFNGADVFIVIGVIIMMVEQYRS